MNNVVAEFIARTECAIEALRVSYIALLAAGCEAEKAGDLKSMRYYDTRAEMARKALIGVGVGEERNSPRRGRPKVRK